MVPKIYLRSYGENGIKVVAPEVSLRSSFERVGSINLLHSFSISFIFDRTGRSIPKKFLLKYKTANNEADATR